jgi:hypothetical protein
MRGVQGTGRFVPQRCGVILKPNISKARRFVSRVLTVCALGLLVSIAMVGYPAAQGFLELR